MSRAGRQRMTLWLLVAWFGAVVPAAALERHDVSVDGHVLRVWEKSPPAPRATLLLVHGRTWSSRPDFDLQVPGERLSLMDGLVARGIAAYGVDLRGYGETPRDATGWLTPNRAAADVAAVLRWLADRTGDTPFLFGWSYGAMVSQLTLQQQPDLAAGLILFGYPVRPGVARDPAGATGEPPRHATTAEAARSDFITPGSISEKAIEAFVEAALAADPVRADWRALAQWRALSGAAVRVPTLLLQAAGDPLARDDVHAELFATLATDDKAWVVIPGGDHAAFMETPRDYFLAQLTTFLLRDAVPPDYLHSSPNRANPAN